MFYHNFNDIITYEGSVVFHSPLCRYIRIPTTTKIIWTYISIDFKSLDNQNFEKMEFTILQVHVSYREFSVFGIFRDHRFIT